MRAFILAIVLTACASSNGTFDSSITPRAADAAPPAVLAARDHAVAVYVNATCDTLPPDGDKRGTGFWITPRIVVTAGHAMKAKTRMFPDFAVVGPDGCMDAQYGDWNDEADVLFLLVRGTHEGHLDLAERLPTPGEPLWQFVFQGRNDLTKGGVFSPIRVTAEKLRETVVNFGSMPQPHPGDSGAPVLDAGGKLIGMTVAIGQYEDDPTRRKFGVHLSSLGIRYFLGQCGPCEEE